MKKKTSLLVVDIGNTSTSLGIMSGQRVQHIHRIEKVEQTPASVSTAVRQVIQGRAIDGVGIASVVPSLNTIWHHITEEETGREPLFVSHHLSLGVLVTYPQPKSIGADRLANAAGGMVRYGAPVIIADFGTAVTFDLITQRGGYIGGVIAPGLPLMFDYLAERTAQLPRISWAPVKHRVGKSTTEAMQLGAHWGYRGMVREILNELKKTPALRDAAFCATGGYADRVLRGITPKPVIDPTLTLFGIGCIYGRNR